MGGLGAGGGGPQLGVVSYELKVKNTSGSDSFIDYRSSAAVVVPISHLLEKTNGGALASVNNNDAGLGHARSIDLPHAVKLGNVFIGFLHNLLGAVEASTVDDDGLGKVAVIGSCIRTHSAVKKRVDVAGVLPALLGFKTTGIELAGVMCVGGNASKRTGFVDRNLSK